MDGLLKIGDNQELKGTYSFLIGTPIGNETVQVRGDVLHRFGPNCYILFRKDERVAYLEKVIAWSCAPVG